MTTVTVHYNIIFFYHSNSTYLIIISFTLTLSNMLLWVLMVLLALHYMASKHLRVLNLNLWVIEYVIIVVDIFDNLDRLILTLFLRFRGSTSSLMWSMHSLHTHFLLLLISNLFWVVGSTLMTLVTS